MKSRYVLKHLELKLYTTVIKPVVLYGCETRTMAELMKLSLEAWEWKIERYMAQ
jgi:hypothetical protein